MKGLVPSVRHCLVAVAMLRAFPSCILKSCLAAHNLSCPVAVKIITVSHQTFDWPILVYVQSFQYMLGQLCPDKSMGSVERSAKLQQKSRHSVLLATFSKWQHNWIRTTKPLCGWWQARKTAPQAVCCLVLQGLLYINMRTRYGLYAITHQFGSEDQQTWGASLWLTTPNVSSTERPWSSCVERLCINLLLWCYHNHFYNQGFYHKSCVRVIYEWSWLLKFKHRTHVANLTCPIIWQTPTSLLIKQC